MLDAGACALRPRSRAGRPTTSPRCFSRSRRRAAPTCARSIGPIFTPEMAIASRARRGAAVAVPRRRRLPERRRAWCSTSRGPRRWPLAAALAPCFDPVFVFDNWPHPLGVVPAHLTLGAALYFLPSFERARPTRSGRARRRCSSSIGSGWRRTSTTPGSSTTATSPGLPSREALQAAGIRHMLYVTPDDGDDGRRTISTTIWSRSIEGGIDVKMLALSDFSQTPLPGWPRDRSPAARRRRSRPDLGPATTSVARRDRKAASLVVRLASCLSPVAHRAGTGAPRSIPPRLAPRCHFHPAPRAAASHGGRGSGGWHPAAMAAARGAAARSGARMAASAREAAMIRGIFGRPFVDLEPYVDLDELAALDDEISLGLTEVAVDYTGGSHKSMGIVPAVGRRTIPTLDYGQVIAGMSRVEFARFVALSDTPAGVRARSARPSTSSAKSARGRSAAGRCCYLEYRHGVYFPWKVYLRADAPTSPGKSGPSGDGQGLHRRGPPRLPAHRRLHRAAAVRAPRSLQPARAAVERSRHHPPRRRRRGARSATSSRSARAATSGSSCGTKTNGRSRCRSAGGPTGSTIATTTVSPPIRSFATRSASTACSTPRFLAQLERGLHGRPLSWFHHRRGVLTRRGVRALGPTVSTRRAPTGRPASRASSSRSDAPTTPTSKRTGQTNTSPTARASDALVERALPGLQARMRAILADCRRRAGGAAAGLVRSGRPHLPGGRVALRERRRHPFRHRGAARRRAGSAPAGPERHRHAAAARCGAAGCVSGTRSGTETTTWRLARRTRRAPSSTTRPATWS